MRLATGDDGGREESSTPGHRASKGGTTRYRVIGRYRIRCRDSSTTTTAPISSALIDSSSTTDRRAITWSLRVLCNLNTTTLAFRPLERAAISPKSRSQVQITLLSAIPLSKISPLGKRWSPSSDRCVASCPLSLSHSTTRAPMPTSARNLILFPYTVWTSSLVNHAAYSIACWMSSRSRSG